MKLSAINQQTLSHATNFKGLWGSSTINHLSNSRYDLSRKAETGLEHTKIVREYYPFLDESVPEINKVVEDNTKTITSFAKDRVKNHISFSSFADYSDYITEHAVKVMPKLTFTAAEFASYTKKKVLPLFENSLELTLKKSNLQKYLIH